MGFFNKDKGKCFEKEKNVIQGVFEDVGLVLKDDLF